MPHRSLARAPRALHVAVLVALLGITRLGSSWAAPPEGSLLAAADPQPEAAKKSARDKPSEAQYIARLQRAIEADQKQLDSISCEETDPQSEYRRAEAEFERLDTERSKQQTQLQKLKKQGKTREAAELQEALKALDADWQTAQENFDLAIQWHKTLEEKAASLKDKIQRDSETLDSLLHPAKEEEEHEAPAEEPKPAAPPVETPPAVKSPIALLGAAQAAKPVPVPHEAEAEEEESPEVVEALAEVRQKQAAAQQAAERAKSVAERFEALQKNITVEQQLLDLAKAKAARSQQAWSDLSRQVPTQLRENPAAVPALTKKLDAASRRFTDAQGEVHETQTRLDELRSQLVAVQEERIEAMRDASDKRAAASDAEGKLARLQNPFSPHNLMQWSLDHGIKLFTILLGTLALHMVVAICGRQIAQMMARAGSRGTMRERENRALTLVGVFRNVASLSIVTGGVLMALDEVGIPIMPLMGGAAVLGLAVAFGAQNLVRDYFSGFMVLMEDQYGIQDVVKIGDVSGSVELITLRITVLRDLEGVMHFIPHGSITRVSNMTHGWSRAVIEVGVSYREDPDHVMDVLMQVARDLRKDPAFGPLLLEDPEMLGVERFDESAIMIKFCVKTHPLKRWPVRRELLRRIKHEFDRQGIDIPFPHRTLLFDPSRLKGLATAEEEPDDQQQAA